MKQVIRACAAAALIAAPLFAAAQAKAEPEYTLTGNAGLFSDYRFRGLTQTDYKPAFQGGFDFAHKSGFYLGNWNSNVEQFLYNGASLEMDFYGGYKGSAGGIGYDVGALYYYYPGTGVAGSIEIDNTELYVGGSYGPASLKYYHAVSDFFGIPGTKNSYYLDLSAGMDLGSGFTLGAHVGYQKVKGLPGGAIDDNVDYKLGVTKDLAGWAVGLAVIGNSEKEFAFTGNSLVAGAPEGAGKTGVVLSIGKTF